MLVTLGASGAITAVVADTGFRALVITGPAPPPTGRFDPAFDQPVTAARL